MVLGDNGILAQAKLAAEKTREEEEKQKYDFKDLVDQIDDMVSEMPTVEETIKNSKPLEENTKIKDMYGNTIVVPEGFRIVKHGEFNVEYNYTETEDHIPSVQDGIVVADKEDNQFVWVPIGRIKNKKGDKNGETTIIELGRYKFDIIYNKDSSPIGSGKATLVQSAEKYDKDASEEVYKNYRIYWKNDDTNSYFYEPEKSDKGNIVAKSLKDFVESGNTEGGYYLARYEATGDKNNLKSQTGNPIVNITQPEAATASREMYKSDYYTSDLANSYAWDTAIVFIQKYSGDEDYSKEMGTTFSTSLRDTGAGTGVDGDKIDKVCNIYDMASNCREWTTETAMAWKVPCTVCGSCYSGYALSASRRDSTEPSFSDSTISFRPILYVNIPTK